MWIFCRPKPVHPAAAARNGRGFSLIELMIALVVLGLLAGVALPSFLDAIRKSRRSDAMTALNTVMQAQERFRSNRAAYADSVDALGLSTSSPSGYYTLSVNRLVEDGVEVGYQAIATATAGKSQAKDGECSRLRIRTRAGNLFYGSSATGDSYDETAGNRCWSR